MFVTAPEGTILHADLDAFYASVEQRDDPRLRGRPVIVGGGVVLAASYEAKAFGIRTAMGGAQARRLCPWAIVVEPRISAYSDASKSVFEVFEDTTPLVEGLSIDEAFLEVGGLRRVSGTSVEIATRLRRERNRQDERFRCLPVASCRRCDSAWDPRRLHTLEVRMEHDHEAFFPEAVSARVA